MRARTLRRPVGGWGARRWRAEVIGWLWLAILYLSAGATTHFIYKTVDFVAVEIASL